MNEQALLPTYADRLEQFKKVKQRILTILYDFPHGLSRASIEREYFTRYRHNALIDNRLRELRKEGEVISFHEEGKATLLWQLDWEKWRKKT